MMGVVLMNMIVLIVALIIMFTMVKAHIINNLILIEFITILNIMLMFNMFTTINMENYLTLFILIILITESIVGLSLMINIVRTHGNDFLKSSTIIKL